MYLENHEIVNTFDFFLQLNNTNKSTKIILFVFTEFKTKNLPSSLPTVRLT